MTWADFCQVGDSGSAFAGIREGACELMSAYWPLVLAFVMFLIVTVLIRRWVRKDPNDNVKLFWKYTDLTYYCVGGMAVVLAAYGFLFDQWVARRAEIERASDDVMLRLIDDVSTLVSRCEAKAASEAGATEFPFARDPGKPSVSPKDDELSSDACEGLGEVRQALRNMNNARLPTSGKYGGGFPAAYSFKQDMELTTRWKQIFDYTSLPWDLPPGIKTTGREVTIEDVTRPLSFLDLRREEWERYDKQVKSLGDLPNFFRILWPAALGIAFALRIGRVRHELQYLNRAVEKAEGTDLRAACEALAKNASNSAETAEQEATRVTKAAEKAELEAAKASTAATAAEVTGKAVEEGTTDTARSNTPDGSAI